MGCHIKPWDLPSNHIQFYGPTFTVYDALLKEKKNISMTKKHFYDKKKILSAQNQNVKHISVVNHTTCISSTCSMELNGQEVPKLNQNIDL